MKLIEYYVFRVYFFQMDRANPKNLK
jgi:hypothetical protein